MNTKRLFLAIWPNPEQIEQLYALQGQYADWGREVAPENFHITLLFLGEVDAEVAECLNQSISSITFEPFCISLDQLGYFAKTKIFWIGPQVIPQELEMLFKRLRNYAQRCGISKLSKRYVPHVTLLRKSEVPMSDQNFAPIEWQVNDFHLVESQIDQHGAHYYTLESYPQKNQN